MEQKASIRNGLYYILYYSQWVAGIVVAVVTALASNDPAKYSEWPYLQYSINWGKQNTAVALGLAVYIGTTNYVCQKIGPPWAWKAIQYVIDRFQTQIIKGSSRPKVDEHRVTLFKFVRWNFRFTDWRKLKKRSGLNQQLSLRDVRYLRWFKPIVRSGHVARRLSTRFPFYESETTGEGVIGQVWRTQGVKRIENLPPIPPVDGSDPNQAYKTYAEKVNCDETWLRSQQRRTRARSYCGIPIEVNGTLWGVIIIDSLEPQLNVTDEQIELTAVALGKFIEKA